MHEFQNEVPPFPSVKVKKIVAQFRAVLGGAGYHKLIMTLQSAIRFVTPPKTVKSRLVCCFIGAELKRERKGEGELLLGKGHPLSCHSPTFLWGE